MFYIVFLIAPFFLFFVANIERFPILDDIWPFFKKNADCCFGLILCVAFSSVIWFNIAEIVYRLGQLYSTSLSTLIIFALSPYFLLFYILFFDAVLLGYFARRTKEIPDEIVTKKLSVEEKKEPVKKVRSSNRKNSIQKRVSKGKKIKKQENEQALSVF